MSEQNQNETHPFQRTLGAGPYRLVGVFELGKAVAALNAGNVSGHNNMMANAPRLKSGMGTCSHCGMAISFICIVSTGDGSLYGVGSDCVLKANLPAKEVTKLQRIQRERAKVQRQEREALKVVKARDELATLLTSHSDTLKAVPHPNEFFASQGKTFLDYINYCSRDASSATIKDLIKSAQTHILK